MISRCPWIVGILRAIGSWRKRACAARERDLLSPVLFAPCEAVVQIRLVDIREARAFLRTSIKSI
jgi:hypothetical protein